MSHIKLVCTRCDQPHDADMFTLACKECGAPLDVRYLNAAGGATGVQPAGWSGPAIPMPLHEPGNAVFLGEGNTPSVELPAVGKRLGITRVLGKLEFLNPSGSFKDRGSVVMVSVAREHGVVELVEDSSGNAGASVSAYAARAGVRAHIFAPASAPEAKLRQIRVYGAAVHSIEGSREDTTAAAVDYYRRRDLVYASHVLSPYFLEGTKVFAYEVLLQHEGNMPRHIVFPVGNGSLIIGAWKGFLELRAAGRITTVPRLHCIQASAIRPIVAAFNGGPWTHDPSKKSVAGGVAVSRPQRKEQILSVLDGSGGLALAVEDEDLLGWQRFLAEEEGVFAEPTSAAAFAGLEHLVSRGEIGADEPVLVPVTGFGLKDDAPSL